MQILKNINYFIQNRNEQFSDKEVERIIVECKTKTLHFQILKIIFRLKCIFYFVTKFYSNNIIIFLFKPFTGNSCR